MRLVVYTDASEEVGGAEASLGNLLESLGSHIDATVSGIDDSVVSTLAARRPGSRKLVLPRVRSKRDLGGIFSHVQGMRRLRPDIVHANLANLTACQYAILAGLLAPGARVIAVEHAPLPTQSRQQQRYKSLLSRRLSAHVAIGERSARATEDLVGLPPGTLRVIYNGVPDIELEPFPRVTADPVIGALGRLSEEKGLDVLVRALPLLPGVTAVLVGDGPERKPLEQLANDLGVGGRVVITGWLDDARRHLPSLDLLVLPSRFEGFPLALPEAMLAGLPVVAADVGSVAEAVVHEETGLLIRPTEDPKALADPIRRLLGDQATRARFGARGRALALERFTAARMARAFETLYAEVLD